MDSPRKTLAHLLTLVGFVAAYSGATRAIHLSSIQEGSDPCACHARHATDASDSKRDGPGHAPPHDSERCALCRQLTIGSKTVVADGPTLLGFVGPVDRYTPLAAPAPVSRDRHESFTPRGPPRV